MSRRKSKTMPVPVVVEIDSLSHEGRGITRVNGKTVFVDGALPGETVRIKYISCRPKYDEAVTIDVIKPSHQRTEPECKYFSICGGCSLQHMLPQHQIIHKQQVLLEQLNHIGNVQARKILPPITGSVFSYRRKARLSVKNVFKKGKVLVGFREKRKPYIADIDECKVLHPVIGKAIDALKTLIDTLSIKTQIPQIEVAIGDTNAAIVIRHLVEPSEDDLVQLEKFIEEHSIDIYLQGNKKNSIQTLGGRPHRPVSYMLEEYGIRIEFQPLDFTQVNYEINKKMIAQVMTLLKPEKNEPILDLFCGLGNFTLPLAKHAGHATGIEGSSTLVERAKTNALSNNIQNIDFRTMDLYGENMALDIMDKEYHKVLLDPPRSGAQEVLECLDFTQITKVVYVSCNPATLARDAGILVHEKGYSLNNAGVMDMFPHTAHVESVTVFEKT